MTPESLETRAATGDPEAFGRLMQTTKDDLYRFVRRYVGDAEEAYDLIQDAYAAAWLAIRRYDPSRPFAAWLRTIAINKCRDWSRRRQVRRWLVNATPLDGLEAMRVEGKDPAPDDQVAAQALLRALDRAVVDLPTKLKEPLLLTTMEDLSQAEVAAILGVSVKTVETRVARARRSLANTLAPLREA
ncbi:RNA polymerase sigma factor [Brevundimonas sp. S1H14]|nr:RNA polymerase sigma factor [Brevundimonas diminuta]